MAINDQQEFESKLKEYERVYDEAARVNDKLEELKKELKPYMQEKGIKMVPRGTRQLELVAQDRSKINEARLLEILDTRISQMNLQIFTISKVFGELAVDGRYYKGGDDNIVRVEVNGEVFSDLVGAVKFLEDHYGLTEQQSIDAFTEVQKMDVEQINLQRALLQAAIITKRVPDEQAVKLAHAEGAILMSDIAYATDVNITYALMMKDPNKKKKEKK